MPDKKKLVELSKADLKLVLKQTGAAVREANLSRGIPMTFIENGEMIELHPDGSRRVLKKDLPPPIQVSSQAALYLGLRHGYSAFTNAGRP